MRDNDGFEWEKYEQRFLELENRIRGGTRRNTYAQESAAAPQFSAGGSLILPPSRGVRPWRASPVSDRGSHVAVLPDAPQNVKGGNEAARDEISFLKAEIEASRQAKDKEAGFRKEMEERVACKDTELIKLHRGEQRHQENTRPC